MPATIAVLMHVLGKSRKPLSIWLHGVQSLLAMKMRFVAVFSLCSALPWLSTGMLLMKASLIRACAGRRQKEGLLEVASGG